MKMRHWSLLLAVLIAMPLQAQPVNDYQAVYHILPLQGETPIGEYRITQRWDRQHDRYVQQASIAFSWKILFSTHQYRYQDEVLFGVDNSLSFNLYENNNGDVRNVKGELPKHAAALTLDIDDEQGRRQQNIATSQFDNTLFAWRFPIPCGPQLVGSQRSARTLIPISGEIVTIHSHYDEMVNLQLPNGAASFNDVCLIATTDSSKEMNRYSWVNRDGYLVYQTAANYRLLLVPEASHLPSNHQDKP